MQQELQTETELEEFIFIMYEKWLGDFSYTDNFSGDLKIDATLNDFGIDEKYAFKSVHEVETNPFAFKNWYNKEIKGRRFALEITGNNGLIRYINPFYITYTYIGQGTFDQSSRYELIFSRTRIIHALVNTLRVIEKITSVVKNYVAIVSNDITINVFPNITVSLFNYGYSLTNDISTVIFQNDPTNNILINLVDGTYFFFAVHRSSSIFDVIQATITSGEITIILSDNNQIITENETSTDEGMVMPE